MNHKEAIDRLDGSDKFFSAIGRFIFEFSHLELFLKAFIANTIDLKTEYVAPVLSQDFALLCTVAETVAIPALSKERSAKLEDLLSKCRELNVDRVRIAHGLWVIGDASGEVHHVSRNKLEPTMYFSEAESIAAKADLARRLYREFRAIRSDQI